MADNDATAGPLDSGNGDATATQSAPPPPESEPCKNCVKLVQERDKLAAKLSEALEAEKTARKERQEAVASLNELVKAVAAGKANPEPAADLAPQPRPAAPPVAAKPQSPGLVDSLIYFPGRVPGPKYDAYYKAKEAKAAK